MEIFSNLVKNKHNSYNRETNIAELYCVIIEYIMLYNYTRIILISGMFMHFVCRVRNENVSARLVMLLYLQ